MPLKFPGSSSNGLGGNLFLKSETGTSGDNLVVQSAAGWKSAASMIEISAGVGFGSTGSSIT